MQQINVVIAFYSRYCETEKLALSVGLGVLQARATPRFRRLADLATPDAIEADEIWKNNLRRMKIEYVAPRPGDAKLADVLVLLTPGDESCEVLRYAESLPADGSMAGKLAAPIATRNGEAALGPIIAAVTKASMTVVPFASFVTLGDAQAAACAHGTALVNMARARKA